MAYGNFEQAVTEFSEAVRLVPTDEEGWQGLAEAHLAAHQEELAMATYQKAIDQQPESVWPYFLRGYYFEKQKRFAEAERDYKVICRLVPGWTDGQDQLKRVQKLLHPN